MLLPSGAFSTRMRYPNYGILLSLPLETPIQLVPSGHHSLSWHCTAKYGEYPQQWYWNCRCLPKIMMLASLIMIGTAIFPKPWNCFAEFAWQWFYHHTSQMWGSPRDWLARLLAYSTKPQTMDQENQTYLGSPATHQPHGTMQFHRGSQLTVTCTPREAHKLAPLTAFTSTKQTFNWTPEC